MRTCSVVAALTLLLLSPWSSRSAEESGLRVPNEFEVTLYAGDELAHDIFSMTLDAQGRVVVAGLQYVKTLHDDDGDGRADRATLFSKIPTSGAHGMFFDGPDLICTGDNSVLRIRDADGDGVADGEPIVLTHLRHPEHGANGIAQGPDGWFYVICGNDAGVTTKHVTTASSPVLQPLLGGVVRFSPDGQRFEVVAHGFRNPYDLAFGTDGSMFTVDADGERDQHLPWYTPTRLFEIAAGRHHGWVLEGWQKSWNRPAWFADNVDRVCEVGRGSPTGVIVYRHRQFPERYHGNVFSCCWTLGRVYHFPLRRYGSTFRAEREIFLETTGDVGFAPVDLAVGPHGDLFVAIGGRRTRGSVFRVRHKKAGTPRPAAANPLTTVLAADEPQSAWSRARWVPAARELGADAFINATWETSRPVEQRVRAVEIVTELFGGFPKNSLPGPNALQSAGESIVLARMAWSLGRQNPTPEVREILMQLTAQQDANGQPDAIVQRAAWEALLTTRSLGSPPAIETRRSSTKEEPRVQMARLLYQSVDEVASEPASQTIPREVLDGLWKRHFRSELTAADVERLIEVLSQVAEPAEILEAIRLVELAFGDIETSDADPKILPGYALRGDVAKHRVLVERLGTRLAASFPQRHREVDLELARLCGMLGVDDPDLPARMIGQCGANTLVTDDLHYLLVLALLDTPRDDSTTRLTAEVLLQLADKMERGKLYPSRNWPLRVGELFERLCRRDGQLAAAVCHSERFGHPDHALFVRHMSGADQTTGARRLLARLQASELEWTAETVAVVAYLPPAEAFPLLREEWNNFAIRDAIVPILARAPEPADRARFLAALSSPQAAIVEEASRAMKQLAIQPNDEEWLGVVNALRRYLGAPQHETVRAALAALLVQWSQGEAPTTPAASKDSRQAYQPYFDWFATKHSRLAERLSNWSDDIAAWRTRLAKVNWEAGDIARGRTVYEKRACHRCHAGSGPLGPDLAGAAGRLSRDDLFAHIVDPNKEVSPLYQTTQVVTENGRVVVGLIVYESPESTLVQTGPDTTVRVAGEEIVSMTKSNQSLMPVGLLNEATPEELADLYAYLQTIRK